MGGAEGADIAFCGIRFDGGQDLGNPSRDRFERGWVGTVPVLLAERLVGLEDIIVVFPSAWCEGVEKKEFNFWRKSAGLGKRETWRPRLASFL